MFYTNTLTSFITDDSHTKEENWNEVLPCVQDLKVHQNSESDACNIGYWGPNLEERK